jgi:hypothetical protein
LFYPQSKRAHPATAFALKFLFAYNSRLQKLVNDICDGSSLEISSLSEFNA